MASDSAAQATTFIVYSRPGCHLCEALIEDLLPLLRGRADLKVIDIDDDAELLRRYGSRIPVVKHQDRPVCEHVLDRSRILQLLGDL